GKRLRRPSVYSSVANDSSVRLAKLPVPGADASWKKGSSWLAIAANNAWDSHLSCSLAESLVASSKASATASDAGYSVSFTNAASRVFRLVSASTPLFSSASLNFSAIGSTWIAALRTPADGCPKAAITASATSCRRSEEHTSELQSRENLVCRLQPEKKNILVV